MGLQIVQPLPAVPKVVRTGSVVLLLTDTTKAVAFSSAMPSTSYTVTFEPQLIGLAASFGVDNKTVNGFDLKSIGIAVTVKWRAIED